MARAFNGNREHEPLLVAQGPDQQGPHGPNQHQSTLRTTTHPCGSTKPGLPSLSPTSLHQPTSANQALLEDLVQHLLVQISAERFAAPGAGVGGTWGHHLLSAPHPRGSAYEVCRSPRSSVPVLKSMTHKQQRVDSRHRCRDCS